jgi:putative transposase
MPDVRRRNSIRYPGYDYASSGAVFVTVCTHDRQRLFGDVLDGNLHHSPAGKATMRRWQGIPDRFPGVLIDAFIVMPDHLHGILITGTNPDLVTPAYCGDIVRWFKSAVHSDYGKGVRREGWPPYDGQLWQRAYYDHIIRNDADLDRVRHYIEANPARWSGG